jgi:hypothetical protein
MFIINNRYGLIHNVKAMDISKLPIINVNEASIHLSANKGIYFWFNKDSNCLVYVGIAIGKGGLRRRILNQHLNPKYLEFRSEKHSSKDEFQLSNSIKRVNKKNATIQIGIDKSAFRKSIGRKLHLSPGDETVQYMYDNFYIKIFESEDVDSIKEMEIRIIIEYEPLFNTAYKNTLYDAK